MMRMSERTRVGVFRGGPSTEHVVSMKSGAAVLNALRNELDHRYEAVDVFVGRDGSWNIGDKPIDPAHAQHFFDVVFNALHGAYGEDGKLQSALEAHGIPFTGSGSLASAVGMNKILTKQAYKNEGIKTPYWKEVLSDDVHDDAEAAAKDLFATFLLPGVVKPTSSGSSAGVTIIRSCDDIAPALITAAKHGHSILVEEFIPGQEATCGVVEGFRGQELYALPVVEIRPKNAFFDFEAKYAGKSDEIVPATYPEKIKKAIEELAVKAHRALGLRHYSRTDFIIHPRRGIYVLETNTLPGMTDESLMPKSLRAVGSSLPEFVDHILGLAIE